MPKLCVCVCVCGGGGGGGGAEVSELHFLKYELSKFTDSGNSTEIFPL